MKILISISLIILITPSLKAESIRFALRPGNTYEYTLSSSYSCNSQALASSFSTSDKPVDINFRLNVIDFQENAFIVDISCNGQVFRRYIKENGSIAGAPAEAGQQMPLFLTFPEGDWQVGKKHLLKRTVNIGRQNFPANWQLLLKKIDNEKGQAEILFSCVPDLPVSRLAQRKFLVRGRILFDLQLGTINLAEWVTEYNFQLHNKEIAITRNLWSLGEKTSYSLKLNNVLEQ
jgi:hypothetical protein